MLFFGTAVLSCTGKSSLGRLTYVYNLKVYIDEHLNRKQQDVWEKAGLATCILKGWLYQCMLIAKWTQQSNPHVELVIAEVNCHRKAVYTAKLLYHNHGCVNSNMVDLSEDGSKVFETNWYITEGCCGVAENLYSEKWGSRYSWIVLCSSCNNRQSGMQLQWLENCS